MVHGADAQSDVDEELKLEPDHVLPVTNVALDALDHQLNHEPAEHPSVRQKNVGKIDTLEQQLKTVIPK